jgi:hypothetical protein
VGRKLYTYLYDMGFKDIQAHMMPHHLIYGELISSDDFNWIKKSRWLHTRPETSSKSIGRV